MRQIGFWGHAANGPTDGFSYAGLKFAETAKKLGVECLWQDESAPIAISFTQPDYYPQNADQYRIGYTPWESTILPERWIPIMDEMEWIWTTSTWCKEVFEKNGVATPVAVVPHGIDTSEWSLTLRKKKHPFIFLHMGEPADRKGSQIAFDAFQKVFKNNSDVFLVFKSSTSWVEVRNKTSDGHIIGPVDELSNIQTIKGKYTQQQLDELFSMAHCMVYPSQGEGFGLIPFQAIGTGMPTILTPYSGMTEFSRYGIPFDFTIGPSKHGYHEGEWAWPDVDDLASVMLDVYENYPTYSEISYYSGEKLRKEFSWEDIVGNALSWLDPLW